jgi:DNA helicase II / ATP-dependent DNA helicase PcrA
MTTDEMLACVYDGTGRQLTPDQRAILEHEAGPAWILAAPGSGKTEVLALTVMKLLFVSRPNRRPVPPEAVFVTTFTEKAAKNLEDRIGTYRSKILAVHPNLAAIDVSKLRIGTLHGLCNDILQEVRAPNYQNVRLMDEFEQALFVHEHVSLVKGNDDNRKIRFWRQLDWMFTPQQWSAVKTYPPAHWDATRALVGLLNRLVEDAVDIDALRRQGGHLTVLAETFDEYAELLRSNFRCDFPNLQRRFLEFLESPLGDRWLHGGEGAISQGVEWVLVDEYQDTNPMQEIIYFRLANATAKCNLMVVGDDDQAMYRFRGGSVECMVTFDDACRVFAGVPNERVARYPLVDNFRSHADIVTLFDEYIRAFPVMRRPGVRVAKPAVRARREIDGDYPVVSRLVANTIGAVAERFAETVRGLIDDGVVTDPK